MSSSTSRLRQIVPWLSGVFLALTSLLVLTSWALASCGSEIDNAVYSSCLNVADGGAGYDIEWTLTNQTGVDLYVGTLPIVFTCGDGKVIEEPLFPEFRGIEKIKGKDVLGPGMTGVTLRQPYGKVCGDTGFSYTTKEAYVTEMGMFYDGNVINCQDGSAHYLIIEMSGSGNEFMLRSTTAGKMLFDGNFNAVEDFIKASCNPAGTDEVALTRVLKATKKYLGSWTDYCHKDLNECLALYVRYNHSSFVKQGQISESPIPKQADGTAARSSSSDHTGLGLGGESPPKHPRSGESDMRDAERRACGGGSPFEQCNCECPSVGKRDGRHAQMEIVNACERGCSVTQWVFVDFGPTVDCRKGDVQIDRVCTEKVGAEFAPYCKDSYTFWKEKFGCQNSFWGLKD